MISFFYLEYFPFFNWNIFLFLIGMFSFIYLECFPISVLFSWYFQKFVIRSRSWNGMPFLFSRVMALSIWWLIFDTVFRVLSAENWASQSDSAARSSRLAASTSLGILRSLQPLHSAPYSVTHNGQNELIQSGEFYILWYMNTRTARFRRM